MDIAVAILFERVRSDRHEPDRTLGRDIAGAESAGNPNAVVSPNWRSSSSGRRRRPAARPNSVPPALLASSPPCWPRRAPGITYPCPVELYHPVIVLQMIVASIEMLVAGAPGADLSRRTP